jgi:hypothetical protein
VNVGGCFSNDSLRLLHPKCSDSEALCLNDGRTGSTFTACTGADCNPCVSSATTFSDRFDSLTISAVLFLAYFSL